jgi:hypothetical protein
MEARVERAQQAAKAVERQEDQAKIQLSLSERLMRGWRRVHEQNHLAQLFHEEGRI